ncbi:MAG: MBOAT family protein [Planctomycetota bacterium]
MNFNSPEFLVFLPFVVAGVFACGRNAFARNFLLLGASYFFYMSWNWRYAGLIALSTVIDYCVGLRLGSEEREGRRKALLVLSLVVNLGMLGVFKYHNFFVDTVESTFGFAGLDLSFLRHEFLLPVGISFYTFQTLSYTIDLYRREIPVERNFVRFAVFVSFFPQLVAGPIVRASEFLPQLRNGPTLRENNVRDGLPLVFKGLFKKVVLADLLAGLGVDAVFADPSAYSSFDLLMGLYGYAFQIYCDFSGYSDIAIGAALMMGFKLPENFNRPYLAQNLRDFWTRWHITLSRWLRDYLYIPLGGNRGSPGRVKFNLMATMVLGGLWHGAAMNFVLWGAWHGILLMFNRSSPRSDATVHGWVLARRRLVCFHLVVISWLLFRVTSMENFVEYVTGLAAFSLSTQLSMAYFVVLASAAILHFVPRARVEEWSRRLARMPDPVQGAIYAGLLVLFLAATMQAPAFIYFQF